MSFTVQKLTPNIGAEIVGLDISQPLNPATVQAVRQAWLDNSMLVFRGQNLDAEAQRRFVGYFGIMGKRAAALPSKTERPAGPDYNSDAMLVSNIRHDGKPIGVLPDGEMWFHHDMSYAAAPNRASFLYSLEIPGHGGDTMFASMYAAYENLPQRLNDRIEGRKVLQIHDYKRRERLNLDEIDFSKTRHFEQPIIITHPKTGRKALYISRLMSARIEGFSKAESEDALEQLFDIAEDPAIVFEHEWSLGDMVIWDNWCSIHARKDFPRDQERLMRRLTIEGQAMAF